MNPVSLYIHIPFCEQKCLYCDFLSYANHQDYYDAYVKTLCHELIAHSVLMHRQIDTVFIGGGTPSLLNLAQLSHIVETVNSYFDVRKEAEWTIEANPGTLDEDKAHGIYKLGFNRISLGLQATDNETLKDLGRIHTYEEFLKNYQMLRATGFENINIDLMYALPMKHSTDSEALKSRFIQTLQTVSVLNPEHISAYGLIIEPGTPFHRMDTDGELILPSEDDERELYWLAHRYLTQQGYEHYEISNYAKPGYESRHNLGYWSDKDYLGVGLGAASYLHGERFENCSDLKTYLAADGRLDNIRTCIQKVDRDRQMEEFIFLGLRKLRGIELGEITKRFGPVFEEVWKKPYEHCIKEGLLEVHKGMLHLTPKGIDLSNYVFSEFILDK